MSAKDSWRIQIMYDLKSRNNSLENAFFNDWFMPETNKSLQMRTDIKEDDHNYVLEVELPGVDKKDIDISLNDGYLTVKAAVNNKYKDHDHENGNNKKFVHRERFYGVASRSYYIGDVDMKTINATFENGILSVSFPKENPEKKETNHRIEIK